MVYADYTYYSTTYMGTVSAADFPRLAVRASSFLDYYTLGKAEANADMDALKMACCALVDQYQLIESARQLAADGLTTAVAAGTEIQSETVGSYSVTRRSGGESASNAQNAVNALNASLASIAAQYLAHTGLLYRGGGGCRCTLPTL